MKKEKICFVILLCFASTLLLLLFGAYFIEFVLGHIPCRLCYLQRLGLLFSSVCLVISLRRLSFPSIGICVMSSLFGASVALRHNCLKLCYGVELQPVIFGKGLPFWSFWIFVASLLGLALLLFLIDEKKMVKEQHGLYRIFFVAIVCAALIGTLSAYLQKGFAL